MLAASTAAMASIVYKWVDADGVTHYSDTPVPGAVRTELGTVQTYKAAPVPQNLASSSQPA
ncbi:MAG TPA: DUF4124 domain-containing protein, partial [Steroidobacteraceae bacterium]|nr:DUF4124 domain-containing protein [Steroidobacteraceae bacterium]